MRKNLALTFVTVIAFVTVTLGIVPTASAHFPATCTIANQDTDVILHFNGAPHSFAPLHIVGTTSVLVPLAVVLNGEVLADISAGVANSAVSLTTCTFTSSVGTFEVTGILTPASG